VKAAAQRERVAPERLTYTAPAARRQSNKKKKQQSYEVDRIVKAKTVKGQQQFQLRWKGFKASFDSWEPATNCACDRLIQQFLKTKKKEAKKPAHKKPAKSGRKKLSVISARKSAPKASKKAVAKKAPPKKKSSLTKSSSLVLSTNVDAHATEDAAAGFAVLQEGTCVWSAMLKCIDIEQNMDKFYVLQVLYKGDKAVFFTRWGRSGTTGQQERMTFGGATKSLEAAKKAFESKFKDKTSFAWDQGKGLDQGRGRRGKYSPITVASSEEGDGKWQYYQDNHMDGKAPGWYDYFAEAVPTVEGVYVDWKNNPGENLNVRCVQSGHFSYRINFDQMCQTNLSTQRERPIRRI